MFKSYLFGKKYYGIELDYFQGKEKIKVYKIKNELM